jgi:GGDEF domain-containing protein
VGFENKIQIETGSRVLLVGNVSELLDKTGENPHCFFESCEDLLDAIDRVQTNKFDIIAVVMPEQMADFVLSLKELRKSTKARIVLLVQMYQEPSVGRFVDSSSFQVSLVDDYIIYPDDFTNFFSPVTPVAPGSTNSDKRTKHLERLATEDDLTGLKNRRYILEFTRQIIELAGKNNNRVTLLLFDIDNFKRYNDLYGHGAGDEILKQAAALMKHCCRSGDVVGRIGGDEFAVVFWDESWAHQSVSSYNTPEDTGNTLHERRLAKAEHPVEAIYMAQRLAEDLKKTQLSGFSGLGLHGKGTLTISGGLASFPRDGLTVQELFMQADKALLDAKRSGKNRIYLVGSPSEDTEQMSSENISEDKTEQQ